MWLVKKAKAKEEKDPDGILPRFSAANVPLVQPEVGHLDCKRFRIEVTGQTSAIGLCLFAPAPLCMWKS